MKNFTNTVLKSFAFIAAASLMVASATAGTCQDNCYAKGQAAGDALVASVWAQNPCGNAGRGYDSCMAYVTNALAGARASKVAEVTAACNATC